MISPMATMIGFCKDLLRCRRSFFALLILSSGLAQAASPIALGRVTEQTFQNLLIRTAADDGRHVYVLVSESKRPEQCFLNPDGTRACTITLSLIRIDNQGAALKLQLGEFGSSGEGSLYIDSTTVYAFQNGVSRSSTSAYALDGHLYAVDSATMTLRSERLVFTNANHGFYPVLLSGEEVSHFSFAGYIRYINNRPQDYVNPETMALEHDTSVVARSRGLILPSEGYAPAPHTDKIVRRILARLSTPVVDPKPTTLTPLPSIRLPQPTLPRIDGSPRSAVGAGLLQSLAIDNDGTLFGWGANTTGELGVGRVINTATPVALGAPDGFTKLSVGGSHSLAIRSDGGLWSWGDNRYGQLGDGSTSRVVPAEIGTGFSDIAAGGNHSLGLKRDGTVWAWGENRCGALGDGTTQNRSLPVLIGRGFAQIAAGDGHSLALGTDGSLWGWGCNANGQLGTGNNRNQAAPVLIGRGFIKIGAGQLQSMALHSDGRLYTWGWNGSGQLGDGTTIDRWEPSVVGSGFTDFSVGGGHVLALRNPGGSLWAWGRNFGGQLGDGTRSNSLTPIQIISSGIRAISAGVAHSLALKTNGTLLSWGYNPDGEVGSLDERATYIAIGAGGGFSTAIRTGGTLWAWGNNRSGQLGIGTNGAGVYQAAPTVVGESYVAAATRRSHTLAISKPGGRLWAWGVNTEGQLGNGNYGFGSYSSDRVGLGSGYVSVAAGDGHSLALSSTGVLSVWGYGYYGQLGNGRSGAGADVSFPTTIATGFAAIAAGAHHSLALKSDGSLWAWGSNLFGQLGVSLPGASEIQSVPLLVGRGYVAVAAGKWHTLALRADGSLWAWGYNHYGQVGDGSFGRGVNRSTPTLIGTGFVSVAAGDHHSLAVRSDGTLWTWGRNQSAQLGTGSSNDQPNPVLIGDGFMSVAGGGSHSLAQRLDGTVLGWGDNGSGQIGDATFAMRAAPVLAANPTVDGPLDLLPDVSNTIPQGLIPPYWLQLTKSSDVATSITYNPADLNDIGSVYIVAYLHPDSMLLNGANPSHGATSTSKPTVRTSADGPGDRPLVSAVLTRRGWKQSSTTNATEAVYTGPLNPGNSSFALFGSDKFDPSKDMGLFCVAYVGTSAASAKGLIRSVVSGTDPSLTQCPALVLKPANSEADCIFDWAERSYPQYFSPPGASSAVSPPYFYRYYPSTGNYVATSSADSQVWVSGPISGGHLMDVGSVREYSQSAGCRNAQENSAIGSSHH